MLDLQWVREHPDAVNEALQKRGIDVTVDEVIEWAEKKGQSGEAQLRPAWVEIDGIYQVVMPGSAYYPDDPDP